MSTKRPAPPARPAPNAATPPIFPIPPKARATLQALSEQRDQYVHALQIIDAKINATTTTMAELMDVPEGYKIDLYNLDAGIHSDVPAASAGEAQERPPAA